MVHSSPFGAPRCNPPPPLRKPLARLQFPHTAPPRAPHGADLPAVCLAVYRVLGLSLLETSSKASMGAGVAAVLAERLGAGGSGQVWGHGGAPRPQCLAHGSVLVLLPELFPVLCSVLCSGWAVLHSSWKLRGCRGEGP